MIYLAGPYSSTDKEVRARRVAVLREVLAHFANSAENLCMYSPIIHWSSVANAHELPHDFHFWAQQDFHMIRLSTAVWVLPLEGWRESYGLSQELEFARDIARPILYILRSNSDFHITVDEPTDPIPLPGEDRSSMGI